MSDGRLATGQASGEQEARAAIIDRCALTNEAIGRISRLQDSLAISFGDAASRLGYGDRSELVRAPEPAQLPSLRERPAVPVGRLVLAHDSNHPRSEQIRSLRTELLLRHESTHTANILAVLSPGPGEGRSQLAAELAIGFAQLGRPTLLVDADLRHPQQHVLFGANNARGLSQALAREQRPSLRAVAGLPALHLLTAGTLPRNPLELLSDRCFESLVAEWREAFEFVVLDTPPVSRYADGLAVATIVGRVLSLSRARHTSYRETRSMLRRLAATRSRILGAVINYF